MIILKQKEYFDYSSFGPIKKWQMKVARNQIANGIRKDRKNIQDTAEKEAVNLNIAKSITNTPNPYPSTKEKLLMEPGGKYSINTSGLEINGTKNVHDILNDKILRAKVKSLDGSLFPYNRSKFKPSSSKELVNAILNSKYHK